MSERPLNIFDSICKDCENGEHVDDSWIVDAFDLGGYSLIKHEEYDLLESQFKTMLDCLEKLYDRGACGEITICLEKIGKV